MEEVAYAVHTRTCTFLLDAEGVCRWIVSRTGMVPPEVRRCVGAQFVACLHEELEGGLAGELIIGAAALFVKPDDEARMMLLRSGAILRIDQRGKASSVAPIEDRLTDDTLDLADGPPQSEAPPRGAGGDTQPPPPGYAGSSEDLASYMDVDADESEPEGGPSPSAARTIRTTYVDKETTVTLTMPLFRPESQLLPPASGRRR
jgi:hypothetical protein